MKTYRINEIFGSVQGEGDRAGTWNVFLRFSKCNMRCAVEPGPRSPGGFDCDTEFESGVDMTLDDILKECRRCNDGCPYPWVIFTGGEPALQVDIDLVLAFRAAGFSIAIETNGSMELPSIHESQLNSEDHLLIGQPLPVPGSDGKTIYPFDWIVVSPKVAEHAIRQRIANEVRYVRHGGQGVPNTVVLSGSKLVSPAFLPDGRPDRAAIEACFSIVRLHPEWRVSTQQHKGWGVR